MMSTERTTKCQSNQLDQCMSEEAGHGAYIRFRCSLRPSGCNVLSHSCCQQYTGCTKDYSY